ncbi:MAG: geranylgeranyl diphosphate reductase [Candidatus Baltobacteraceae bacterium]|jgi:geranylgeranyl reductase
MRVIVVGANVGGSIAAGDLAATGADVLLLERDLKRKKPCGGAIPPRALEEFGIPAHIVERKTRRAVVIGPSGSRVEMDVRGTKARPNVDYIAMVTREVLDRAMRDKAQQAGAELREATFLSHEEDEHGKVRVRIRYRGGQEEFLSADALIGADGAGSAVAKSCGRAPVKHASAIQERLWLPDDAMEYYLNRAELYLGDDVSPDFYGWIFPKSDHVAVGTGCRPEHANQSYAFLEGVKRRAGDKLRGAKRILLEGHPLPMARYKKLVYGRTLLVGDAGGMVAHTSGEGIYFAMAAGRMAAQTLLAAWVDPRVKLDRYEKLWQKKYGAMFDFLEALEKWSYRTNHNREIFVDMCDTREVQELTFDSYLFKQMAHVSPFGHVRMGMNGVKAALREWMRPRSPLSDAPPKITAKEALALTRMAISDGVGVDQKAYVQT